LLATAGGLLPKDRDLAGGGAGKQKIENNSKKVGEIFGSFEIIS
jgi:hypothetical protein